MLLSNHCLTSYCFSPQLTVFLAMLHDKSLDNISNKPDYSMILYSNYNFSFVALALTQVLWVGFSLVMGSGCTEILAGVALTPTASVCSLGTRPPKKSLGPHHDSFYRAGLNIGG